jgi:hypothetical protein
MIRFALHASIAALIGFMASAALHLVMLAFLEHFNLESTPLGSAFLALRLLLAGRGFEVQAVVVPLNVLVNAVVLAAASFLLLRKRALRRRT